MYRIYSGEESRILDISFWNWTCLFYSKESLKPPSLIYIKNWVEKISAKTLWSNLNSTYVVWFLFLFNPFSFYHLHNIESIQIQTIIIAHLIYKYFWFCMYDNASVVVVAVDDAFHCCWCSYYCCCYYYCLIISSLSTSSCS